MSSGTNRAYSTASDTYLALPCWKFLIEASASKEAPSNIMARVQAGILTWESPLLSTRVCVTLAYLAPF